MENQQNLRCEYCGSNTEYKIKGSCHGWWCINPDCDWAVVSTYIPEIYKDETEYKIYLLNTNTESIEEIKFVSKIMNRNYISAKAKLAVNPLLLKKVKAPEVLELAEIAKEIDLQIKIEPMCKYLAKKPSK